MRGKHLLLSLTAVLALCLPPFPLEAVGADSSGYTISPDGVVLKDGVPVPGAVVVSGGGAAGNAPSPNAGRATDEYSPGDGVIQAGGVEYLDDVAAEKEGRPYSRSRQASSRVRTTAGTASGYDPLPMRFEEMGPYDQIAMEPFRNRYDSMSITEKAEVYGRQFEFMHSRRPNFDPDVLNPRPPEPEPMEGIADEFEEAPARRRTARKPQTTDGSSRYDILPMRFADMNQYDQIAMEPFRDKYDSMPIGEKAAVYGRQFEFMHSRPPNFDPAITELREGVERAQNASSAYESKQYMYKPATPKKPRPKRRPPPQKEERQRVRSEPQGMMEALPGPWERVPEPEPDPVPEDEEWYGEDFEDDDEEQNIVYPTDKLRMENLRRGWNAKDIMRGNRKR